MPSVAADVSIQTPSRQTIFILGGLVVLVFVIYAQVRTHAFIDFDDPDYVTGNPQVLRGLTWSGLKWAFTHVYAANWFPLTWLSHMTDVQLFGVNAGAHLLVNVFLHALNSVLVFLFLRAATGAIWRSAAVASLFAVHPLNVESVAWLSERKSTLSTAFFLLCLLAYTAYARKRSRGAYGASVVALGLGLMAKPMLVTTPFVLLLLDFWPLQRLELATLRRLVIEKIPFVLLIIPSIMVTLFAQRVAMASRTVIPLALRIENAGVSYIRYLFKTAYPSRLAVMYPFPGGIDPLLALLCGFIVIGLTFVAYRFRTTLPWLFVGWCWFVGMLVPVIGIVQVGGQAMADRYVYVPHIGLFLAVVWTIAHFVRGVSGERQVVAVIAGVAIVSLAAVAHAQVRYWSGSIPLFEHTLAVTSRTNTLAHVDLAAGLLDIGEYAAAESEYRQAEGFKPAETVYIGLSASLAGQGKYDAAVAAAEKGIRENPRNADAWEALGSVELARGNIPAAERALTRSVDLKRAESALTDLSKVTALLMISRGQMAKARDAFAQAIASHPKDADLHNDRASVLAKLGDDEQAMNEYAEALRLNPNLYDAHMNYGAILSRRGRPDEAARQFAAGARIRPRSPEPHVYLALLEDSLHHFDVAGREIEQAIAADHDGSNRILIDAIRIPARPTAIDEYLVYLRQQSGH